MDANVFLLEHGTQDVSPFHNWIGNVACRWMVLAGAESTPDWVKWRSSWRKIPGFSCSDMRSGEGDL
ncbi:hypothetical protein TNCT_486051 [Trichonephila clavata]|uniref:Uncharacterized protein n=1 Tax=Trichonephila clavata TaxID=2740835 RepID=A0A8X6GQC8_TRICU|nr:hypothetical protein TNCT_486051 [Trichonephila clavata]